MIQPDGQLDRWRVCFSHEFQNHCSSSPRSDEPKPEVTPPPGDVPKKFPESTPLGKDEGMEAAPDETLRQRQVRFLGER